jgi:hypothetical protein
MGVSPWSRSKYMERSREAAAAMRLTGPPLRGFVDFIFLVTHSSRCGLHANTAPRRDTITEADATDSAALIPRITTLTPRADCI